MDENISVYVNRRKKLTTREELEKCSKEELVNRIVQLEAHNQQLKNMLRKDGTCVDKEAKIAKQKKFDFSTYHTRHVLLKLYYLGWDYQGFATQEESVKSIEYHLFAALKQTCLIERRENSNYHRCGRTDKGVSAFSQVISIDLRSKFPPEKQMTEESITNEIHYCDTLNRILPPDIRAVAWQPLYNPEFSSRFDCRERIYRYFFPRSNLNIDAMQQACKYLIGIHDYRNLCKIDVANGVIDFDCELRDVRVVDASGKNCNSSPYDMHYVELIGKEFLWHQVRAIMAILVLVGQGDEKPEIIKELLDVERITRTPQYTLAADYPLNLFHVEMEKYSKNHVPIGDFIIETHDWRYDTFTLQRVIGILQQQWTQFSIRSHMILEMLNVLEDIYENKLGQSHIYKYCDGLQEGVRSRKYKPLLQKIQTRDTCGENQIPVMSMLHILSTNGQAAPQPLANVAKTPSATSNDFHVNSLTENSPQSQSKSTGFGLSNMDSQPRGTSSTGFGSSGFGMGDSEEVPKPFAQQPFASVSAPSPSIPQNAVANVAVPNIQHITPIFKLDADCLQEIFDYLSLMDLSSVGQTCTRMQKIAGYCYEQNYGASLSFLRKGNEMLVNDVNVNGFVDFIQKVLIDDEINGIIGPLSFIDLLKKAKSIKKIQFNYLNVTVRKIDSMKEILGNVECVKVHVDKEDIYLLHYLLASCLNLKYLSIDGADLFTMNRLQWLNQRYPKLESMEFLSLESGEEPSLKTFFQLNTGIKRLAINDLTLWHNRELFESIDLEFDVLDIHFYYDDLLDPICGLLNELYEKKRLYKKLHINFNCYPDQNAIDQLVKLNKLVKLSNNLNAFSLSSLVNLEELFNHDARDIYDLKSLPITHINLKRISFRLASFDDILPFIRQSVKINKVEVKFLSSGKHFCELSNVLDLSALNKEREKLTNARKITIYVNEVVYLATKWAMKQTDYTLIEMKRIDM